MDRLHLRPLLLRIALVCAAYLAISACVTNPYYQLTLTLIPIWAVFGLSWNTLSGYTGLISFGHAAFFGIGAFTVALGMQRWDLSPIFGIPLGVFAAVTGGVLIGIPTFRLRGHYFALAMLAFPLAMLYVAEWLGFQELTLPMKRGQELAYLQFKDPRAYTALAVGLLAIALVIEGLIERSRFGLSLQAIKQNEAAAEAAGIDTLRWKFRAMMVSASMAGAAGGLYAVVLLVVTPQTAFGLMTSAQALIVTLFGGVGTLWGPLIGAAVLIPLAEVINDLLGNQLPGIQGVVFGLAIIAAVLLAPEGVFWKLRDKFGRRAKGEGSAAPQAPAVVTPRRPIAVPAVAPVLRVSKVSRAFGGLKAVDDVSFSIDYAGVVGIIGPNGAGKTTLFNLLNGFVGASSGSVQFNGTELVGLKPHQVCREGIARTFQVVRAFPRLSLLSNVIVGAFPAAQDGVEARGIALAALERVGLAHKREVAARELTSKELRLMELARALAGRPRLILLDEPLAGLAGDEAMEFVRVVGQLRAEGITVVIIEHTMHAMMNFADRFIVLNHGRVIADGDPHAVMRDPLVVEAYLGKRWRAHAAA